ncbi:hypothetical protein EVAR_82704_1 [Eumeta japonica]|uniref:Uncharacterized protein n=1 Tax=Eumeta variegata TaxID=151549 RepID=A0A4C1YHQ2_EUMVA|nr:hypothetical protein EVAR_82704_1 [Eumeta japonica]
MLTSSSLWGRTCSASRATPSPMMLLRRGNPEKFHELRAVGTPCAFWPLRRSLHSLRAKWAGALMLQKVFSPCESDTLRAPGCTD